MKQTINNTANELSIEVLKQLAFMQYEGDPYFIFNGKAYIGDEKKVRDSYNGIKSQYESFDHYCSDECDEVEEFDNDDYLVLTDEEADEKAKEYITDSLWAFNPSFLANMTDFDEEIFQAIADNGKCESNNDVIYNTIQKTCGINDFVEAAVQADGRGHFMSSYDGNENEETVQGETFYIYRQN
jgi:hypothetical protein